MTELQNRRVLLVSASFLFVLGANLFSYGASAQDLTIPNTFAAGTPAVAAEVNANFDAVAAAVNGDTSTAEVTTFFLEDEVTPAPGDVVGTAELSRIAQGLNLTLHTTMLTPGAAYTIWWIIFNNPEECSGVPCGLGDLGNALVNPSVFWSTGGVVQDNGVGNFQATIDEGEPSKGPDGFLVGTDGLVDAAKAEVHVIIKYHGPASNDPDELFLQTNTVLGLCDDRANALPDGNCFDPQIAMQNP